MSKKRTKTNPKRIPISIVAAKYGLTGNIILAIAGLIGAAIGGYFVYQAARVPTELILQATQTAGAPSISTATPDEILLIITDFDDRSGGTVNVDPAPRIYNLVTENLPSDTRLRVEQLHIPFKDSNAARQALETYDATILIWGWFDQIGAEPHVELDQNRINLQNPNLPEISLATPDSLVISFTEDIPALASYTSFLALGVMQFDLGMNDLAHEFFDQAILSVRSTSAKVVDPWEALAWRGLIYRLDGENELAIADYTDALKLHDFQFGYNNRGNAYKELGKFIEAFADYDKAIHLDPNFADAYSNRGVAYAAQGNYAKAIADFTEAIRLDPNSATIYNNRGTAYYDHGMYEAAIDSYNDAIYLNPNLASAYYGRANAYLDLGNPTKAFDDYNEAIQLNPTDALAYYNRGLAYVEQGNYTGAIKDFTEVIQLSPNNALGYTNRGHAYYDQGNYTAAIDDLTEAIGLNPNSISAYTIRGLAYVAQGKYAEAIADYKEAIRIDPNYAAAYCNLGKAYAKNGNFSDAVTVMEAGLQMETMPWCQTALENARNGTPTP